jgi:hypothetical protein
VAVLRAVWEHVFEDSSIDERPGALVPKYPSAVLAADAVAPRLKHAMEAEVEVLPPRWREFALRPPDFMLALRPPDFIIALQNVSAFNKTGGDAPAVLLVVPAIIKCAQLRLSQQAIISVYKFFRCRLCVYLDVTYVSHVC